MKKTKVGILCEIFIGGGELTVEELKKAINVKNETTLRTHIHNVRKGTKQRKDGTYVRPPLNVQSVKIGKRYDKRHYKLISKGTSNPSEAKEVLLLAQKRVTTMGKDTFKPTAETFFKQVSTIEAKKFILLQQERVIDSYLIEGKEKKNA